MCINFDHPRCYDVSYLRRRKAVYLFVKELIIPQLPAFLNFSKKLKFSLF